jgi:hypothetical protein
MTRRKSTTRIGEITAAILNTLGSATSEIEHEDRAIAFSIPCLPRIW